MRFTLFLCCCIAVGMAQAAELYRWVDADGKVHYTDQPPPASAKKVEEKNMSSSPIDTSELSYAMREAVKKSPVTLYANECGEPCKQARDLLAQRGIPFTSKDPQASPADAEALKKLVGATYVPTLVVGSAVSKGYEKDAWSAVLDAAGYPKDVLVKKPNAKDKPVEEKKPEPVHPWSTR